MSQLSYSRRLAFFIAGALLLCIVAYALGFRKTTMASDRVKALREQEQIIAQSNLIKRELETKLREMNLSPGDALMIEDDQEYILSTIHNAIGLSGVKVVEMTGTDRRTETGMVYSTYGVTVEGAFTDLVRLIRTFEESSHEGSIVSTTFYRFSDTRSKRSATRLEMFFQEYDTE